METACPYFLRFVLGYVFKDSWTITLNTIKKEEVEWWKQAQDL